MTLPLSRNTSYTAAAPVLSADLNALQDQIVRAGHGLITRRIPATSGAMANGAFATGTNLGSWAPSSGSGILFVGIPVYPGERIVNVRLKSQCGTTDVFLLQLFRAVATVGSAGSSSSIANATSSGHSGVVEAVPISGIDETVATDASYTAIITMSIYGGAGTTRVWAVEVDVDAP